MITMLAIDDAPDPGAADQIEIGWDRSAGAPDHAQAVAMLARIVKSPELHASQRQRRLLTYLVEETLAGRAARLKAYNIATAVLGRGHRFDPQTDPVVRIEVSQLRRCLERYYLTDGRRDPMRITIPKGHYAVRFDPVSAASPVEEPQSAKAEPRRRSPLGWTSGSIAAGAAILAMAILLGLSDGLVERQETATLEASPAAASAPLVRIDPFTNTSGDPQLDEIASRLSADLAVALSRFKMLEVLPPQGESGSAAVPSDYRVSASINKLSDAYLVTMRLRDAKHDAVISTKVYSVPDDAQAAHPDIAGRMAMALGDPLGELLVLERQRSPSAARRCLLAFYEYLETARSESHRALRDCHESIVRVTPNHAQAWAHLAILNVDEDRFGHNPIATAAPALDRALEAAQRAVRLDPSDARAHLAVAMTHWFRHEQAASLSSAETALMLNPNDPVVLIEVGHRWFLRGDFDKGSAMIRRVTTGNPDRRMIYHTPLAAHSYLKGEYRIALDELIRAGSGHIPTVKIILAATYGKLGRGADAQSTWASLSLQDRNIAAAPRATMLARGWPLALVDALMAGLEEAGLPESRQGDVRTQPAPPLILSRSH